MRFLFLLLILAGGLWAETVRLEYAPAPVANPLKGLVPYPREGNAEKFPHSMEFIYMGLDKVVVGEGEYDWGEFERVLGEISGRGNQAVVRFFVEYPERASAVPGYLRDAGKGLRGDGFPDYESVELRACLHDFVAVFGKKYDGDARLGFICVGLLGKWGEWHTWPEDDRWASEAVQVEVLDGFEKAFTKTPLVVRYPRGEDDEDAGNASRAIGYHDDSFAWSTLADGSEWDNSFMAKLKKAGATEKWKREPIGGEIRPEAWGIVFDEKPSEPKVQDFAKCVELTRVSWLMDSGLFSDKTWTQGRRARAEELVRRMGYEFFVSEAEWSVVDGVLRVGVKIENRGVAPFYVDWPMEFGLLNLEDGNVVKTVVVDGTLVGILPGEASARRGATLRAEKGEYLLALRVPNLMEGGLPVRFANETQDADADGWLSLGRVAF